MLLLARIRERLTNMARSPVLLPLVLLVTLLSVNLMPTDAFSVQEYNNNNNNNNNYYADDSPQTSGDMYIDMVKRYRGWGHKTRFPWQRLPTNICYRQPCKRDKECCRRYNICDINVHVCRDCWYGSACKSKRDCCENYPYCLTIRRGRTPEGKRTRVGKCVSKI